MIMMGRIFVIASLLLLFSAFGASAQTTQPSATNEEPTTRHVVTVPPGFARVEVTGVVAFCEPADEAWVRQVLANLDPVTRPSTMPAELYDLVEAHRPEILRQLPEMLALDSDAKVRVMFDEKLVPVISRMRRLDPPIRYLVTTRPRLKELLRDGTWSDPRFYYNRAADDVTFDLSIPLSVERELDETILPALYKPEDPPDDKARKLREVVRETQASVLAAISRRCQFIVQMSFIEFIADEVFQPLNLKPDQAWIGLGVAGALGARYASLITGTPKEQIIAEMTYEHPRHPVKDRTIDLLDPTDPQDLRRNIVPLYIDAMRRKSTRVIDHWIDTDGTTPITQTIQAMRQQMPPDGEGLVNLIRKTTGTDLAPSLKAN